MNSLIVGTLDSLGLTERGIWKRLSANNATCRDQFLKSLFCLSHRASDACEEEEGSEHEYRQYEERKGKVW